MAKPSLTNCPKHRPSAQRPRAQASDKRQQLVVSKRIQYVTLFQAVIAPGFHLFPFRTEKLSPAAPMVLRKRESRSPPPLPEVPSTHTVRKGLRFFPRFSRISRCSRISRFSRCSRSYTLIPCITGTCMCRRWGAWCFFLTIKRCAACGMKTIPV